MYLWEVSFFDVDIGHGVDMGDNVDSGCLYHHNFVQTAASPGDPHVHLIPSALPSHSGTYSCVAQNVLGQVKVETKTKAEKAKKTKTSTNANTMVVKKA